MKYSIVFHNGYYIVSIGDKLSMLSKIDKLRETIVSMVAENKKRIAVQFADYSFLSSHSISILISCNNIVQEAGGKFMIAGAPVVLQSYLDSLGIKDQFTFCNATEEMKSMIE